MLNGYLKAAHNIDSFPLCCDMRISEEQFGIIRNEVMRQMGSDARVRLFGSRVDDNRRGGDNDLLVESIAYRQGFIDAAQLEELDTPLLKSGYDAYLMQVLTEKITN